MVEMNDLPNELLEVIFSYLSFKEKFKYESVCRRWQQNIYSSVRCLAFGGYEDVFHGYHTHKISKETNLPIDSRYHDEIMKCVISKCGQTVRSLNGTVSCAVMETIVQFCPFLHCVNIRVVDVKTLKLLGEKYGMQLTCATLRIDVEGNISSFLSSCTNLVSLAVISPYDLYFSSYYKVNLFDVTAANGQLPQYLMSVRNLVIEGIITHEMLNQLMLFNDLEMVGLQLSTNINELAEWETLMRSWRSVKALSLDVTGENSLHFDHLPQNLEYLSLQIFYNLSFDEGFSINILTHLPKLKTLHFYEHSMPPEHLRDVLECVFVGCPTIEKLSVGFTNGLPGDHEQQLSSLLAFSSLKQLSLGYDFEISDAFASNLITQLDQLTSFGVSESYNRQHCDYLIPAGQLFWDSIRDKAQKRPLDSFKFVGKIKDSLHLHEPLPTNITVDLMESASIKLSNGFGQSHQWSTWTARWSSISSLGLEIEDVSFTLSAVPTYLEKLNIKCINKERKFPEAALTFQSYLPRLMQLVISLQTMSNSQLSETLKCVFKFCPALVTLCISRGNDDQGLADNYLDPVFQRSSLQLLCLTENISVSDEFGARLATEVNTLRRFGCGLKHQIGYTCGPLFLKALVSKVWKGGPVVLNGGPSRFKVQMMMKPLKIPRLFHIFGYTAIRENVLIKQEDDRSSSGSSLDAFDMPELLLD